MIRSFVAAAALTSCSAANEYEPEVIAMGQGGVLAMTTSDQHLYFAARDGHAVRRVPLAGGTVEELANFSVPIGPVAFARRALFASLPRELVRIDPQTREVAVVAKLTGNVTSLAVEGDSLFFSTGTAVYRLAPADAQPVLLDGRDPGETIAVDATHLYMLGERLARVPIAGGPREDLGMGAHSVASSPSMVVHDRWIYWTSTSPGRIRRSAKSGGPSAILYEQSSDKSGYAAGETPANLAIAANRLWFTGSAGGIWYAPLDGSGSPIRRVRPADAEFRIVSIAVASDAIYWSREGTILRATPP